jgi:high-affinity iron transporter
MVQASGQGAKAPEKTKELIDLGKQSYSQNCAVCHGANGDGNTPVASSFNPKPTNFTEPPANWSKSKGDVNKIFDAITKGIQGTGMVSFSQLPEKERWGQVYYVMEFAKTK